MLNHVITIKDILIVGGIGIGIAAVGGVILAFIAIIGQGMSR